jgi:hypothetical protein
VDDPVDAANFVSTLLPNVKYAMEGMSNPEAREVATDCHKILESINTTVEAAPKASTEEVLAVSGGGGGSQAGREAEEVGVLVSCWCRSSQKFLALPCSDFSSQQLSS